MELEVNYDTGHESNLLVRLQKVVDRMNRADQAAWDAYSAAEAEFKAAHAKWKTKWWFQKLFSVAPTMNCVPPFWRLSVKPQEPFVHLIKLLTDKDVRVRTVEPATIVRLKYYEQQFELDAQ